MSSGHNSLSTCLIACCPTAPAREPTFRHSAVCKVLFTYVLSDPYGFVRYYHHHLTYAVSSSSYLYYGCPNTGWQSPGHTVSGTREVDRHGQAALPAPSPFPFAHHVRSKAFPREPGDVDVGTGALLSSKRADLDLSALAWGQSDHFRLCSHRKEISPQAVSIVIKLS